MKIIQTSNFSGHIFFSSQNRIVFKFGPKVCIVLDLEDSQNQHDQGVRSKQHVTRFERKLLYFDFARCKYMMTDDDDDDDDDDDANWH